MFPSKKTLVLFLGIVALLAGFYLTLDKLKVTLEMQLADRFIQAVDQLGKENLELRLGGIYGLERIAKRSEKFYGPTMEVLVTYVREHAAVRKNHPLKEAPRQLASDVQAALNVIGRRKYAYKDGETQRLDLRGTDLRRANLAGAKLTGAILSEVHLEEANLTGIRLDEAILRESHLEQTNLTEAKMEGAFLLNTRLDRARLRSANLREAFLGGASFDEADLLGADLTDTTGLTWDQIKTAKKDNRTRLPDDLKAQRPASGNP